MMRTWQMLPATAIIPTCQRAQALERTLSSLLFQSALPIELVVIDGSADDETMKVLEEFRRQSKDFCRVAYLRAQKLGAACQRNQGIEAASQPTIWFMDDDILFEPECLIRLWTALHSGADVGGASAMITNQRYHPPGVVSSSVFRLMGGKSTSYAGRVLGPAVALLPEDRSDLPESVPVEWLNTTCTIYRRDALPDPVFASHFTGYSLMEDVTLSLLVARKWRLVNARTARIFHDSQPGDHKADIAKVSAMELVNRHYIMTHVLNRTRFLDYVKLGIWELFQILVATFSRSSRPNWFAIVRGKANGIGQLLSRSSSPM